MGFGLSPWKDSPTGPSRPRLDRLLPRKRLEAEQARAMGAAGRALPAGRAGRRAAPGTEPPRRPGTLSSTARGLGAPSAIPGIGPRRAADTRLDGGRGAAPFRPGCEAAGGGSSPAQPAPPLPRAARGLRRSPRHRWLGAQAPWLPLEAPPHR